MSLDHSDVLDAMDEEALGRAEAAFLGLRRQTMRLATAAKAIVRDADTLPQVSVLARQLLQLLSEEHLNNWV